MTQIITFEELGGTNKDLVAMNTPSGGINTNVPLEPCDLIPISACTNLQFYYGFNLNVGETPNCRNDFSNNQVVIPPVLFNVPDGKTFSASYVIQPQKQITLNKTDMGFDRILFLLIQAKCGDFYIGINSDPLFRSRVYMIDSTDLYSCCDSKRSISYQSINTLSIDTLTLQNYYPSTGITLIDGSRIKDIRLQVILIGY